MARSVLAVVVLGVLVATGVLAGCARTPAEHGASARPDVTASPSPTSSPPPMNKTPTPTSGANAPTATPGSSNSPFGEEIAVTNPEGPGSILKLRTARSSSSSPTSCLASRWFGSTTIGGTTTSA